MKESKLSVELSKEIGQINKNLYGNFSEHLGRCIYDGFWVGIDSNIPNYNGIRKDLVDALKEIHIPVLRWPGGCFADAYHWRDGIGPRDKRPIRYNNHWDCFETNQFGTHEFFELCELLGSEPYVCGNLGSGTIQEMTEWLEYLTYEKNTTLAMERKKNGREKPFNIKYWGIGNENWGCGGSMSAQYYANEYKRYATYVAETNPSIYKIACGANAFDFHWTEKFFSMISGKACECASKINLVDGYSFHYYTHFGGSSFDFNQIEWYCTILNTFAMEDLIQEHRKIMDKYDPNRRMGLLCDEWGTWFQATEKYNKRWLYQENTMRDAIVAAINLNIFNQNCDKLVMANLAQTVNVLQSLALTENDKMVLTPTYFVFKMYVPHQNAHALRFDLETPDISRLNLQQIHASCSRNQDTLFITMANLSADESASIEILIPELKDYSIERVNLLSGEDFKAMNTFDNPDNIKIQELDSKKISLSDFQIPPASVSSILCRISN